ncbi:MAG: site-2 protease family protein [Chloroflexota bacterium]
MKWALPLAHIAGVRIYIHSVFLLLVVFTLWPAGTPDLAMALNLAVILMLLLVCVLLHELGHTVAAQRYGLAVRKIVLWPFGGMLLLDRPPDTPSHDLLIALAGPLVNIVLGGIALVVLIGQAFITGATVQLDYGQLAGLSFTNVVTWLCLINAFLVLINLVPADPFDGAYIFRSMLHMFTSHAQATTLTRILGWLCVVLMGVLGLVLVEAFFITTALLVGIALFQKRSARRFQEVLQPPSEDRYKTIPLDPAQLEAVVPPARVDTSTAEK